MHKQHKPAKGPGTRNTAPIGDAAGHESALLQLEVIMPIHERLQRIADRYNKSKQTMAQLAFEHGMNNLEDLAAKAYPTTAKVLAA